MCLSHHDTPGTWQHTGSYQVQKLLFKQLTSTSWSLKFSGPQHTYPSTLSLLSLRKALDGGGNEIKKEEITRSLETSFAGAVREGVQCWREMREALTVAL